MPSADPRKQPGRGRVLDGEVVALHATDGSPGARKLVRAEREAGTIVTPTLERSRGSSWHSATWKETAAQLGTNAEDGLNGEEAARRLQRHGPNALPERGGLAAWQIFLEQFKSVVIQARRCCWIGEGC